MSFLSAFISFKQWLTRPVIEDFGIDRPFRLRRVSLYSMAAGWTVFFASCLIGLWLVRHNFLIASYLDLASFDYGTTTFETRFGSLVLQNALKAAELVGATLFIGGMISVSLFDKADRVPVWRAE